MPDPVPNVMDVDLAAYANRLARIGTSVISDVLDRSGYRDQVLTPELAPIHPGMRFAGPAICFSGRAVEDGKAGAADAPTLSPYEMDRHVAPGAVVVATTGGHRVGAVVGGLMCLGFRLGGCAGLLVDGAIRDRDEIVEMGLPAFARHRSPMNAAGRWALTEALAPVTIEGQAGAMVEIGPGDIMVGDADGTLVVPRSIAAEITSWSEHLAAIEESIVRRMRAGEPREAAFAANPRFAHIRRLRD